MKKEIEDKIKELENSLEVHKSNFIAATGAIQVLKDLLVKQLAEDSKTKE